MARPVRLRSDLDLLQRLFSAPAGEVPRKLSLRRRTCGQRLKRADLPGRAAYGDGRDEPLPQRHRPTGDTFEPARDSHANRRTIPAQGGKETLREAWNNPGAYRRSSNVRANGRRGGDCEGTAEDCGGTVGVWWCCWDLVREMNHPIEEEESGRSRTCTVLYMPE